MGMPMKSSTLGGMDAAFQTLAECKRWLGSLSLTNPLQAQAEIATQLENLAGLEALPAERLRIAEHLRETVDFVQGQSARKYLNKPLPLGAAEAAAWQGATRLWRVLGGTYRTCLEAALAGDAETATWLPLITHRCLRYTGFLILEQYREYLDVAESSWRELHALYRIAEERGFATQPVKDSLNRQQDASTCQAAYVHALLIAAANPYQLTARHLNVLDKWLDKWAVRVPLSTEAPVENGLTVHAVDVEGAAGPFLVKKEQQPSGGWRYLHTARLAEGVRKRIKFLRKGGLPVDLDIGEECAQPGCEAFLTELYWHWCEPLVTRSLPRRPGGQRAHTAFGLAGAHFCASGMRAFEQPHKKSEEYSRDALHDLQLFGHVREQAKPKVSAAAAGVVLSEWDILDESALGFRLGMRAASGFQVVFNQLLALRPEDASTYVLGSVKWLHFLPENGVQLGVRTLPGAAEPVAARLVKLQAGDAEFTQAFLLPAMPALQEPASLVLPRGWFKSRALVEVHDGKLRTLSMNQLLESGSDFERVSFTGN